jgi:hypothetical protein
MEASYTYVNDDGDDVTVELPTRFAVCDDCEGHGTVMNESMRQHAYTREEFFEAFPEPEDQDQYFKRGGIYDVQCPTCKGNRVVPEIDDARLDPEQREHAEAIAKSAADRASFEREWRHEREMGY